jgi:hypothetical protein
LERPDRQLFRDGCPGVVSSGRQGHDSGLFPGRRGLS